MHSPPFSHCFSQWGGTQRASTHDSEAQSRGPTAQARPSTQRAQVSPPQSTSVSSPFVRPSSQDAVQTSALQSRLSAQSSSTVQKPGSSSTWKRPASGDTRSQAARLEIPRTANDVRQMAMSLVMLVNAQCGVCMWRLWLCHQLGSAAVVVLAAVRGRRGASTWMHRGWLSVVLWGNLGALATLRALGFLGLRLLGFRLFARFPNHSPGPQAVAALRADRRQAFVH
jgi:hypothetical protein